MLSEIFKKYSLKVKILAMVVPLLFWLSLASLHTVLDYHQQVKQLNGIADVADAFDDFGKLINALQLERGMSTQFLNKKISKDDLQKQRDETDKLFAEAKRMLTVLPYSPAAVKELTDELDLITALRKKIDDTDISATDMQAGYTKMIRAILMKEATATVFFSAKQLEIRLVALTATEELKEYLGRNRAIYTAIFLKNSALSLSEAGQAESLRTHIVSALNSTALTLSPQMEAKAKALLSTNEWNEIHQAMLKVGTKATTGEYGVDSSDFFSKISGVIAQFNELLTNEREDTLKFAKQEALFANRAFYGIVIFILMTIVGIGIFCWFIIKDLVEKEAADILAAQAAFRSASMVENSPIATMMCEPEGKIIYMNKSSINTLKKLQQHLPEKVENMIGKSIDIFHTNPAVQRKIINDPKSLPHKAVVTLGPEKLDLLVTASIDETGKYLGAALSWSIVTDKVDLIRDLTQSANDLSGAASNVMNISSTLSAAAEETSAQANTASVASEEVNSGVQTVASNMEEMVAAIKEITKITNEAASMTMKATDLANNANQIINKLGDSSMDIGNVIKVISSIAQQTNLLALNATIEAARAGEAGKGFAVVANEVKELANQTAKATHEITKKIETIQEDSKNAVSAIADISSAVEQVNGYTGNIAASVEEQAATTHEVTRIVTESAEGVRQISENITQVSQAAASTGRDAGTAQGAAKNVGEIAELLKKYVARLKIE